MFDSVIAQGSFLGVVLALCAALLRVVQSQYERMLDDKDKDIATAKEATLVATKSADDNASAIKELVGFHREQAERQRDREAQIDARIGALGQTLERVLQSQTVQSDVIVEARATLRELAERSRSAPRRGTGD